MSARPDTPAVITRPAGSPLVWPATELAPYLAALHDGLTPGERFAVAVTFAAALAAANDWRLLDARITTPERGPARVVAFAFQTPSGVALVDDSASPLPPAPRPGYAVEPLPAGWNGPDRYAFCWRPAAPEGAVTGADILAAALGGVLPGTPYPEA